MIYQQNHLIWKNTVPFTTINNSFYITNYLHWKNQTANYSQNFNFLVIQLKLSINSWIHSKKDKLLLDRRSAILLFKFNRQIISSKAKTISSLNTKNKCNNLWKKFRLWKIVLTTKDIKKCKKLRSVNNKFKNWSKNFIVHHQKIEGILYMGRIGTLLHMATDICHLEPKILFFQNLKMKKFQNFKPILLNKWTRKILNLDHKFLSWPKRFIL